MSLYSISESYLNLLSAIEEQEGVLTEDQEEFLKIVEEQFAIKSQQYCQLIKVLESDILFAEAELARIKKYAIVKSNTIKRLKENLLNALVLFGKKDAKKDIWRHETGTFKLSTRKSQSVVIDEEEIEDRFRKIAISNLSLEDKVKILDALGMSEGEVKIQETISLSSVKEAIKEEGEVEGASMQTNYSLQIR